MASNNNLKTCSKISVGFVIFLLCLVLGGKQNVAAQAEVDNWTFPSNLSRSGSTDSPVMVVDSEETIHVVWRDEFDGQVYTKRVDGEWSIPKSVNVPWSVPTNINAQQINNQYIPTLLADSSNRIHAFWIGEENSLYYSNSPSGKFADKGWISAQELSESVIGFDVTLDQNDGLHISYVRTLVTEKTPAGVYYRTRNFRSTIWKEPVLLYESGYFRAIETGDIKVSTLVLDTIVEEETTQSVFVSWDNRPRRELFLIRSGDAGQTWDAPIEVSVPKDSTDTVIPIGVGMVFSNEHLLVVWKEMEMEIPSNCTQYSQVFSLSGEPVNSPTTMLEELPGCPLHEQILINKNGLTLLETKIFNAHYLLAWDGRQWSLPQPQPELSTFFDLETYQPISLQCIQVFYGGESELFLIGCDSGTGGDVWFTSRTQKETEAWFSQASVWSSPTPLISSAGEITSVSITSDTDNLLHALWAQSPTIGGDKTIYYGRWNGTEWTHILSILNVPFGKVNHLATVVSPDGRLLLVWSGGENGEIYFSWAKAKLAGNSSEWANPIPLPMPRNVGSKPDIIVSEEGAIYVAYAIPLNEKRGIYLTQSNDDGTTWSDSTMIIDAARLGWEVVDQPSLGIGPDGRLQVLFIRFPPPNSIHPKALYYSTSIDNGKTWLDAVEVKGSDILWSATGRLNGDVSYRLWQEINHGGIATQLETSSDGLTWTSPINFATLESRQAVSGLVLDSSGQLHLLQISERASEALALQESLALQEWIWDGRTWDVGERLKLGPGALSENNGLAAGISSQGNLLVLFTKNSGEDPAEGMELIFTGKQLDLTPVNIVTTNPTEEIPAALEPTPTPTPSPAPSPTSRPDQSNLPEQDAAVSSVGANNMILGVFAGFLSASFIVLGTVFIFSRFTRQN